MLAGFVKQAVDGDKVMKLSTTPASAAANNRRGLVFSAKDVCVERQLGEGRFAVVSAGVLSAKNRAEPVAVKSLRRKHLTAQFLSYC